MTNHNNQSIADLLNAEDGRGRRILPWILEQANRPDEMTAFRVTSFSTLHAQIWDAANDPSKLAEMMTCVLKRIVAPAWASVWLVSATPTRICAAIELNHWGFDAIQARRVLLQWNQLPNGAREQAEHILRSES